MIRYLKNHEIDFDKWNHCISASINGLVYAYSWYLDIVCSKWEALVEDDYKIVFPLTAGKKIGIDYLFQPYFSQQLGVFSPNLLTQEKIEEFFRAIPSNYKFIEINVNKLNKINTAKFNTSENLTYELELINSYENIYKNYSDNTKRNLKKAIKSKVSIVENTKPDIIIKLFRENRGKKISNLKENNYKVLSRLIYKCIYKGKAKIYGAYSEKNELCAGAFFIESNKKAIFLFSAISEEARKNGAMFLLIDNYIKENSQKELILDFEGSNDENLARFYNGFGAEKFYYLNIRLNGLSKFQKLLVGSIKGIRKMASYCF